VTESSFGWKHFARKPPSWWDPPAPCDFEHSQLTKINELLENSRPRRVLEIGVGRGRATPWIKGIWDYFGIEVNATLLEEARKHLSESLAVATGTNLPIRKDAFDAIVSFDVFMHIWERDLFLSECWRVLKPGGLLLLNYLRRFSRGWRSYLLAWMIRPMSMWRSRDRRFDTWRSLHPLLTRAGFSARILMGETSVPIVYAIRR